MRTALVVGLLPGQAQRVQRALGHRLKLRFATSEHARSVTRTADVNVLCLDYIDHTAERHIKRRLQSDQRLLYVRGLDKNVIAHLETLCQPSF